MQDTCREILDTLQGYLDGEHDGDVDAAIAAHLHRCPPCLHQADFQRELKRILQRSCTTTAPPGLLNGILSQYAP